jgi:hypothetical protein
VQGKNKGLHAPTLDSHLRIPFCSKRSTPDFTVGVLLRAPLKTPGKDDGMTFQFINAATIRQSRGDFDALIRKLINFFKK